MRGGKYNERLINKEEGGKGLEDNHHILPSSLGGTNSIDNIVKLLHPFHQSLHNVLSNGSMRDQILMLLKISQTALSKNFLDDIEKIVKEIDMDYYYKNGIYRKK